MKIGLLRETSSHNDPRVALTPEDASILVTKDNIQVVVQASQQRVFSNEQYLRSGISIQEDLRDCDLLLGIKHVDTETILEGKSYMFFGHVGKKQRRNKAYFQQLASKKITLIDYEYFLNKQQKRILSFSHWAGVAGAHYALGAVLKKLGLYKMNDDQANWSIPSTFSNIPPIKAIISGSGNSSKGVSTTLNQMGFKKIDPKLLNKDFDQPVYCIVGRAQHMTHIYNKKYSNNDYMQNPETYSSELFKYLYHADLYFACHYWDKRFPVFLSKDNLHQIGTKLKVIADVTCDINGSIACTVKESTHDRPFYDYNFQTGKAVDAFCGHQLTVMAVGNLPAAMPEQATKQFSLILRDKILPRLVKNPVDPLITKATILCNGELTPQFHYLYDYLNS